MKIQSKSVTGSTLQVLPSLSQMVNSHTPQPKTHAAQHTHQHRQHTHASLHTEVRHSTCKGHAAPVL